MEIKLNGIVFSYKEIHSDDIKAGHEKLYFFSDSTWKELSSPPTFEYLYQIDNQFVQLSVARDTEIIFYFNKQYYKKAKTPTNV